MDAGNCPFHSLFLLAALHLSAIIVWLYGASYRVSTYHPCCVCALGHMIHMCVQVPIWYLPLTTNRLQLSAREPKIVVKSLIDRIPDTGSQGFTDLLNLPGQSTKEPAWTMESTRYCAHRNSVPRGTSVRYAVMKETYRCAI